MKIVCTSPSRIPSESANSIQAMKACHALAQLGHEVVLIVPGEEPAGGTPQEQWAELARQYGLEVPFQVEYIPPYEGKVARRVFPWRAVWRAHRYKPDVVYTWYFQSATAALLLGIPAVVEIHDVPPGRFGRLWYRLFLRVPGKKRQLVITERLADDLRKNFNAHLETIISPNGVELDRYAGLPGPAEARKALGLPDRPTVACTGHLYAGRGVELFLALAERLPEVQFLWAGGFPKDVRYWEEQAAGMGLANTTFTGFVPNAELPRYQAAAEMLLMPYARQVGGSSGAAPVRYFSSMKMFEYMAAERPIITSDLPVIHETLDAGSALFCPPEDVAAWQAAVERLLREPELAASLAGQARAQVEAFTWTARAEKALRGW